MKHPWAPGFVVVALAVSVLAGCGNVGPPVPPEMVGIGAKIQREKDKEKARAEEEKRRREREIEQQLEKEQGPPKEPAAAPGLGGAEDATAATEPAEAQELPETPEIPEGQDVELPPLRPIGTPR